ncbi:MAG: hypothetical protein ABSG13_07340 [Bryobacteraceae bacterium]
MSGLVNLHRPGQENRKHKTPPASVVRGAGAAHRPAEGIKIQKFRERIEHKNLLNIDVSQLSEQQLEALADRRIRSAVGNDSALVAQTRRELEAKVRVIDGKAEAVPAAGEQ